MLSQKAAFYPNVACLVAGVAPWNIYTSAPFKIVIQVSCRFGFFICVSFKRSLRWFAVSVVFYSDGQIT
jgi:hypothetical protein